MDPLMIVLRLVHVGTGVFWAGTLLFAALYLEPSIRGAGPAGGAVMQQLQRLRYFTVMPVVALLTLVSGFWMYWKVSNGFDATYMGLPVAMALGTGAILATIAFLVGMIVLRPMTLKVLAIAAQAQQAATPAERDALMASTNPLRARMRLAGCTVAVLLALTVVTMAVARYL